MNMGISAFLAAGSAGWGYLKILWAYIDELSDIGKILMLVFFILALVASVCSIWWYPRLATRKAAKRYSGIEWIALPKTGYYPPFILFFILFPVFGLFTDRCDTWWIFMIEGWLAALLIILYVTLMRKMTLAIMKAGGSFYLSRLCGLFGWTPASKFTDLSLHKKKYIGYNSYELYYEKAGSTRKYSYLSDANFPSASLSKLREFIRAFSANDKFGRFRND